MRRLGGSPRAFSRALPLFDPRQAPNGREPRIDEGSKGAQHDPQKTCHAFTVAKSGYGGRRDRPQAREKVLAAQRAGLKRVILPSENEPELEELPVETRRELDFVLVDSIEEVFDVAFDGAGNGSARPTLISERQAATSR